eukprot:CAMPEP_0183566752 /NCGR_PEP_ID=MMETSP0371-20130417/112638_1 /TAXON_ID=268820 /ORGANISM="Peridinium aciculiferum, Strain PAER-2" /LENGTH=40 /DNA_ID= /DNA_START= /DNA_END= /DNA_ORIENTATION=
MSLAARTSRSYKLSVHAFFSSLLRGQSNELVLPNSTMPRC